MSVTVRFNYYSELCKNTMYGSGLLNLPDHIIDALDDYFDGQTIDFWGNCHPDNVFVNGLTVLDAEDVLVFQTKLLTRSQYSDLLENDGLQDYIEQHSNDITDRLGESFYVLGMDGDVWYCLD